MNGARVVCVFTKSGGDIQACRRQLKFQLNKVKCRDQNQDDRRLLSLWPYLFLGW